MRFLWYWVSRKSTFHRKTLLNPSTQWKPADTTFWTTSQIEGTLQIAQLYPEMAAPCDGAHDETEQVIAQIWRKILGVEHIGMKDNFFEMGADSLSALRVMSQIKSKLSARISVQDLYEHPTIEALSKWLGSE